MYTRESSAWVTEPERLDSYVLERGRSELGNKAKREKHSVFWLSSVGYLWRGSIHPLCSVGRVQRGWEFYELAAINEAPPLPTEKLLVQTEETESASGR